MKWLGLDIGGANLKAADGDRYAIVEPFALWEKPSQLADALRAILASIPKGDHLAATMTGELADCFVTKTEGVEFIIAALQSAADGRHTRLYLTNGSLVAPAVALRTPLLAAASNWHALARFAGSMTNGAPAVLIDIGTTTCDLIPIVDGQPAAVGQTDTDRLRSGELVYTGVERSPLCAVVDRAPYRGAMCPLAQELFATTWDVYLTLGALPEQPQCTHTANHRPATRAAALDRLARSICADRDIFTVADAQAFAEHIAEAQLELIARAAQRVVKQMSGVPQSVVISGAGEFLARRVVARLGLDAKVISLGDRLGPEMSQCATAHALAVIARGGLR